jgi:hypothetical protein
LAIQMCLPASFAPLKSTPKTWKRWSGSAGMPLRVRRSDAVRRDCTCLIRVLFPQSEC